MKRIAFHQAQCIFRFVFTAFILPFFCLTVRAGSAAKDADPAPIEGTWDITITKDGKQLPSWLEVRLSGRQTLVGRFVYAFGSARPISKVTFSNGKFSFAIPPQWEPGESDMQFDGNVAGDSLSGSMIYTDGKSSTFTGVRAPALTRQSAPVWGKPITLFNGRDLNGWHATGENQWKAVSGLLQSPHTGSNLVTDQVFTDFKLHIEFRYQKGSNSGVYLRGRYEVQIEDDKGFEPLNHYFSAIYGFLPPNEMTAKDAGEWQTYDVTLIGRLVTVVANGKTVISNQLIPGITGGAINSREGEPGPILLQGDHGPIDFRNIVITPAK